MRVSVATIRVHQAGPCGESHWYSANPTSQAPTISTRRLGDAEERVAS